MKITGNILLLLLAVVVSCERHDDFPDAELVAVKFTGMSDVSTRTIYDDGAVLWEASDRITLLSGENFSTKTELTATSISDDGSTATFEGLADGSSETYIAVYPAADANAYDEGKLRVSVPSAQVAVADGWESGLNVSVAVVGKDADILQFRNVSALLSFKFTTAEDASDVKSIIFRTRKSDAEFYGLSGNCTVTLNADNVPAVSEGDADHVTVSAPADGFRHDCSYYVPVCPVGECLSMQITCRTQNGKEVTMSNDLPCSLERSHVLNIGLLPTLAEDESEDVVINLDFNKSWPFDESCAASGSQRAGGEKYTCQCTWTTGGTDFSAPLPFVLSRGRYQDSSKSYYSYISPSNITGKILNFSADSAWIKLPAISGKRLKSVALWHDGAAIARKFRVQSDISSQPEYILWSDAVKAQEYDHPVEMKAELADSKEGWPYVVKFTEPGNFRLFKMVLTYTDAVQVAGKKTRVGIMGDSISTFAGELFDQEYKPHYPRAQDEGTPDALTSVTQTWWGKIVYEYMTDAETDAVSSMGGSKVISQPRSGHVSGYPDLVWDAGMVDRVYDFNTPDIIFIHGGTNDNTLQSELGTHQYDLPIMEMDAFKFCSAYASMVRKLKDYYTDVQIILIIGNSLSEPYARAIISVAEHYDLPYVSFIGDEIEACATDNAGIHPNPAGHAFMAKKIYESCKDYLL